jgi:hypothetical protein
LGLLSPPNPSFSDVCKSEEKVREELGRSSENIRSNSGGDQEKKERQGETQKTIRQNAFLSFESFPPSPTENANVLFWQIFFL